MPKIRVVLFGLGNMGRHHFRVINEDSRFELVAVVDPFASGDSSVPIFRSPEAALQMTWDLALVAAPTELHFELVHKILEQDRSVLVEKPAAATKAQANTLVALAQSRSLCLAVGNIERSNPVIAALRQTIASGILGDLVHFSGIRVGAYPSHVKIGNDVILDLAVHELDVFRTLLGPLEIRHSMGHCVKQPGIVDQATISVASVSGASGTIQVDWLSPQRQRQIRVIGTKAIASVDYIAQTCGLQGQGLKERWEQTLPKLTWSEGSAGCDQAWWPVAKKETLKIQLEQMHRYLTGLDHDLATADQLVESVALIEQASQHIQLI